jgi:co-chaperonin GroES (HSP10)
MTIDFDHLTTGVIEPISDHIIVTDIETELERMSTGGIIIPTESRSDRGIRPRWAYVYAVGPEQLDVEPNTWILIEHGRWTRGVKLSDGKVYRKVNTNDVLLATNEKPY